MHRPFYGLTIQRGNWKTTPIDVKRINETLKPTGWVGGGLGVGGTEHAGNDRWMTISTPKTNNPLYGINPAPTYKSVSVPHVVVNDGRPAIKGQRRSGGGIGNNYSRGGGKQGGQVFDSQNNRGDFGNGQQIVMNSFPNIPTTDPFNEDMTHRLNALQGQGASSSAHPDHSLELAALQVPTGAFGNIVEDEVMMSHMDPNSVIQPPPAPVNNNRMGRRPNQGVHKRRDIVHNAVNKQLRDQLADAPVEMARQLRLQQEQFAQRENAQALLVSNQFQSAQQKMAHELEELRAQTHMAAAANHKTMFEQANTISHLERTVLTKYDEALEAQDRATRAAEQTKLQSAADKQAHAQQLQMLRLEHEENMARQLQNAAQAQMNANTLHNHTMQKIHAEATLAQIAKAKEVMAEQIDQNYKNADEMKLHGDNIASLGPNSIVNHGVPRISATTQEPLPPYNPGQDYEFHHAMAVREQVEPPNMYGGSGAQAEMNIQRSGGIILPPSKLKQGGATKKLTKIKTSGLTYPTVKRKRGDVVFERSTKRSRK